MTGDKLSKIRSSYNKGKSSGPVSDDNNRTNLKCKLCGGSRHDSREKECKAYEAVCNKCGKKGHCKKVCRSQKLATSEITQEEKSTPTDPLNGGVFNLSTISTGDLVFCNGRIKVHHPS